MKYCIFLLFYFLEFNCFIPSIYSQDLLEHVLNPGCGTNSSIEFCNSQYSTYFPMSDDTLRALVVFANYPDGDWDPINYNSNLIYLLLPNQRDSGSFICEPLKSSFSVFIELNAGDAELSESV